MPTVEPGELGPNSGDRVGPYLLGQRLGRGGMGVVYESIQHLGEAKRPVALKIVNPLFWAAAAKDARERFVAETNIHAKLQYDGLARLYDVGQYRDPSTGEHAPYLVMELVRNGLCIIDYARSHRLPVQDRLRLIERACRAVQHAHSHRVIHRDLKPSNILVDGDGRTFVVDFGLAQHDDVASLAGKESGTPAYMAPEQLNCALGPIGEKVDSYALGLVLYELMTDERPAHVDSVRAHTAPHKPLPGQLALSLHQAERGALRELLTHSLALAPADRPSVGRLADRIAALIERISERERERPGDKAPRKWGVSIVVALALGLLLRPIAELTQQRLVSRTADSTLSERSDFKLAYAAARLAVLPLTNLTDDDANDILTDGLADEVRYSVTAASAGEILVVDPYSSSVFHGQGKALTEAPSILGINFAVTGTLRQDQQKWRVLFTLVDCQSGAVIWTQAYQYEKTQQSLLALQMDVGARVADEVRSRLEPTKTSVVHTHRAPGREHSENFAAYSEYLRGKSRFQDRSRQGLEAAQKHLEHAVELDPTYALAWLSLSRVYGVLHDYGITDTLEMRQRARDAADRALWLAPGSDAAWAQACYLRLVLYEWSEANRYCPKLFNTDARTSETAGVVSLLYLIQKDMEKAVLYAQRRVDLDPLKLDNRTVLARVLALAGRLEEAEVLLHGVLAENANQTMAHTALGQIYLTTGRFQEALVEFEKEPVDLSRISHRAIALSAIGEDLGAERALRKLIDKFGLRGSFQIAEVYGYIGDLDGAFYWLETARQAKDGGLLTLPYSPYLKSLRTDSRWVPFTERAGIGKLDFSDDML
ncbi:MAG: protein kinase [Pseudomonadota bacterium]